MNSCLTMRFVNMCLILSWYLEKNKFKGLFRYIIYFVYYLAADFVIVYGE
jgi:hypothetical protein